MEFTITQIQSSSTCIGKLFFVVAPFLNNSLLLVDSTLSGITLIDEVCLPTDACQGTSFQFQKAD